MAANGPEPSPRAHSLLQSWAMVQGVTRDGARLRSFICASEEGPENAARRLLAGRNTYHGGTPDHLVAVTVEGVKDQAAIALCAGAWPRHVLYFTCPRHLRP
jgi:hypothetical protein